MRRNQYCAAAAADHHRRIHARGAPVALGWSGSAARDGRRSASASVGLGRVPPFDEHHFVERLGLLTIIVCGESFVKVSLLAADGSLDGIDLTVLVTMFVFVFGVWWSYFDDVPHAGIRPEPIRTAGWLVGHLAVQLLALVGGAVGYGKVLGYGFGSTLTDDKSLLLTMPLVGVLLGPRPDRRVQPADAAAGAGAVRLGVAAAVVGWGSLTWQARLDQRRRRRGDPRGHRPRIRRGGDADAATHPRVTGSMVAFAFLRAPGTKGGRSDDPGDPAWPWRPRTTTPSSRPTPTPARTTRRTASTSTRSSATTSTRGARSTRTRGRTCATPTCASATGTTSGATPTSTPTASSARSIFPNTVPPFYPGLRAVRGAAEARGLRAPPRRHPGPQPLDGRLLRAASPSARAGIGQIFLNDIDDAIDDATWIKEHGLRGGVLLPTVAPDVKWVKPLYDPDYDRLWAALQDLEVPVNLHGGTGSPDYGTLRVGPDDHDHRGRLLRAAAVRAHAALRRVRALPAAEVRDDRGLGARCIPPLLKQLDGIIANVRKGEIGELKYTDENALPRSATEYFHQNCWVGASFPGPADCAAREVDARTGPLHVGERLPARRGHRAVHDRAPAPGVPRRRPRPSCATSSPATRRSSTTSTSTSLAPLAEQYGPTVEEIAQPLRELPENPNSALLRARVSGSR